MTKAQALRDKQLGESLTRKLTFKLAGFKNTYLGDYVSFRESQLNEELAKNKRLAENPEALKEYNDDILSSLPENRRRWFTPITAVGFEQKVKNIEYKLSFKNSNSLEWLAEANNNYKTKFERLVLKLVDFKLNQYKMKIDFVGGGNGRDFGFLISDDKQEVHARVIYACGEIKAPHYRFIITSRK